MRKIKRFTVKSGNHDFDKNHGWWPIGLRKLRYWYQSNIYCNLFTVMDVDIDGWFNPGADGPIQIDGKDWNKLCGVTFFNIWRPLTWPKNRNSVMVGFRPTKHEGLWELGLYVNHADGSFDFKALEHSEGQSFIFHKSYGVLVDLKKDNNGRGMVTASVMMKDSFTGMKSQLYMKGLSDLLDSRWTLGMHVGPWFGGNRKAPNAISIDMDFELDLALA